MSEYQYYEFLALERPLTCVEQTELRDVSSRAEITATRFSNFYNFGDLKAEPIGILLRYFDVFVYVSNFGYRRVAYRLPLGALDRSVFSEETFADTVKIHESDGCEVVEFIYSTELSDNYDDGSGWMGRLVAVRDALLRRDRRPLYIAWLSLVNLGYVDDEAIEPSVPPGLDGQTPWVVSLATFLGVDEYMLRAAAEESDELVSDRHSIVSAVEALDEQDKDSLLVEVFRGQRETVIASLTRLIESESLRQEKPRRFRRCALEIRDYADDLHRAEVAERVRREAEAKREREAAAAILRRRYLTRIAGRQEEIWTEVEELVASTNQDSYDRAIKNLTDLREIAEQESTGSIFAQRLDGLRERHHRKSSFVRRLEDAELM